MNSAKDLPMFSSSISPIPPPHFIPLLLIVLSAHPPNRIYSKQKKLGFSKILVHMKTREAANKFINNSALIDKNLIAFIPPFRTSRQGIIRNVPTDITEELKKEIICPFAVASVRRLNRKIINSFESDPESVRYVPSKTISISFKGQFLPKYIFLHMVCYKVNTFVSKILMLLLSSLWLYTTLNVKDILAALIALIGCMRLTPPSEYQSSPYMR
ncbi:math and lrr domain-containing protein [Lasius niger]|uniref:Math and lrr domain-containing protein n=1 Tax=Lasius niger TaxID=67767 RepID=A0A0J7KEY4_LASNI|nr:math and lrr domain-containing protein [Lasius niger]